MRFVRGPVEKQTGSNAQYPARPPDWSCPPMTKRAWRISSGLVGRKGCGTHRRRHADGSRSLSRHHRAAGDLPSEKFQTGTRVGQTPDRSLREVPRYAGHQICTENFAHAWHQTAIASDWSDGVVRDESAAPGAMDSRLCVTAWQRKSAPRESCSSAPVAPCSATVRNLTPS